MGATRNTGYLENLIQYDASDNVAIATSVNPSYKVTLGGSMLGTSAVFNGSITAGGNITINANGSQANNRLFTLSNGYMYLDGNTNGLILENNSTSSTRIRLEAADTMRFETTSLERLRITSTGDMYLTGRSTNGDYGMYFYSNDTDSRIYSSNSGAVSKSLIFYTSGNPRMTITSGGNVGIGVTPSAWMANSAALQVIRGGLWHDGSGYISMFNNAYYDGTNWRYISSTTATNYAQVNGTHQWFYAASGTAGNIVTFNPAMIINTSGNVGIGANDPKERFEVAANWGNIRLYGRSGINLNNVSNNIYYNGSSWVRDNGSYGAQKIVFDTDGDLFFETTSSTSGDTTTRMTIAGGGNVMINTTSDNGYRLNVSGNIYASSSIVGNSWVYGQQFATTSASVSGVGTSFVNSGITFPNTTATWLVSIQASGDGNMYSSAMYVVTAGAWSKTLALIGGPSNHFGNGTIVAQLNTSEAADVNLQVRRTTSGSATVTTYIMKIG